MKKTSSSVSTPTPITGKNRLKKRLTFNSKKKSAQADTMATGGDITSFKKIKFNSHKVHNPYTDIVEGHIDDDSMMTYAVNVKGDNIGEESMEYYVGENYVPNSKKKSFSRHYKVNEIPKKYLSAWNKLKEEYNSKYKELKEKGGSMAKGGKTKGNVVSELSNRLGIGKEAIQIWLDKNNLSEDDGLKILTGLGRVDLFAGDVVTAIIGKENNKYSIKLVKYVKSDRAFAMGQGGKIDYEKDILPILKTSVENAWKPIAKKYHLYEEEKSEIENRSGEGFLAFTDGGYKISAFNPLSEFDGTGINMPTEKSQDAIDAWIQEAHVEALRDAEDDDESEEYKDAYRDNLDRTDVTFDLRAIYYKSDNRRNEFKDKDAVYVFGIINDDYPKESRDMIEEKFSFESISELKSKLENAMTKVSDWFGVNNKKEKGGKTETPFADEMFPEDAKLIRDKEKQKSELYDLRVGLGAETLDEKISRAIRDLFSKNNGEIDKQKMDKTISVLSKNTPQYKKSWDSYVTTFEIKEKDGKYVNPFILAKGGNIYEGWEVKESSAGDNDGWHFTNHKNFTSALYKTKSQAKKALKTYIITGEYSIYGTAEMERGGSTEININKPKTYHITKASYHELINEGSWREKRTDIEHLESYQIIDRSSGYIVAIYIPSMNKIATRRDFGGPHTDELIKWLEKKGFQQVSDGGSKESGGEINDKYVVFYSSKETGGMREKHFSDKGEADTFAKSVNSEAIKMEVGGEVAKRGLGDIPNNYQSTIYSDSRRSMDDIWNSWDSS